MNKLLATGNLTKDPQLKQEEGSEITICTYTLAVHQSGMKQEEGNTIFYPCISYGKKAIFAAKYFRRGDCIEIEGKPSVYFGEKEEQWGPIFFRVTIERHEFVGYPRKARDGGQGVSESDTQNFKTEYV